MERQAERYDADGYGAGPVGAADADRQSVVKRGVIAGVLGATAVALWFLVVDMLAGQPLYTPEVLGRGVLSLFGSTEGDSPMTAVLIYTIVHYGVFILAGILVSAILRAGERQPSVLAGALILFVAFEVGFYGITALLAESDALGSLAWYQIGLANLVAALVMGLYLWRSSPTLGRGFDRALAGRE